MTYYILKLVIMLPLMAAMIVGALWLYRKYQPGLAQTARHRDLRLVETLSMGTSGRLAVVEFGEQRILLSATRGKIEQVASRDITDAEKLLAQTPDGDAKPADSANPFAGMMDRALAARKSLRRDRD